MLIEELNCFFRSRNDNSPEEQSSTIEQRIETFTSFTNNQILPSDRPMSKGNIFFIHPIEFYLNSEYSFPMNLLGDNFFYSLSFCFGYFAIQYIRQSRIHSVGGIFTRSLASHTCLTYLCHLHHRKLSIHRDILLRLFTSCLHLIAEFMIDFDR